MKSERRHELEQNQLADWLNDGIESVKPYRNFILGLSVLVLIVVVGGTWWMQRFTAESSAAWDAYNVALAAEDPDALSTVAQAYPDFRAGRWANAVAADLYLNRGCNQLFSNRADAAVELDKAAACYAKVLQQSSESLLLNRATYGLARTREAMGELDDAKTLYEKVTQTWPNGPFAAISARRLKKLQEPSTLAFYERFEEFDPKPAFADEPGIPGSGPMFDDDSLLVPDELLDPGALPSLDLENINEDGTK